jgi:monovalent cation/proton antiporter MnhG/PhaG subunit
VSVNDAIVGALVGLGVAAEAVAAFGVFVFRDVEDRLHYTAPASLGALLICAGVLVHQSFSVIGLKAILLAAFLLFTAPVLVHTTGRAVRVAERGDWRIGEDEEIEVEGR